MKTYLINPNASACKANLHCHTVFSDGMLRPEEVKAAYKAKGYSIVAFTDHEFILDHSELSDGDFLAITGCEMQITDNTTPIKAHRKTTHLNLYARDPHNCTHVYFNKKYFCFGGKPFGDPSLVPELKYVGPADAERYHTTDCLNDIIRQAKENGYIVAYNHPAWSMEDVTDYGPLRGLFAMEVYNAGASKGGFVEFANKEYEEMLRAGQRICCLASDDNHNKQAIGNPGADSFAGFTMLYPREFSYDGVIEAMEKGSCYASTGPLFREISFEDGRLHVETSPCRELFLRTYGRRSEARWAELGCTLTEADFSVKDTDVFIRIEARDGDGSMAFSRAYFLNELPLENGVWYNS